MVWSIFFWMWKNGNGTKLEMYCVTKTFLQIQVKECTLLLDASVVFVYGAFLRGQITYSQVV